MDIFDAPFCVIADHPTWPAAPLIQEMVKRSIQQGHDTTLITRVKRYQIPGTVSNGTHVYIDGADRMLLPEIRRLQATVTRLVLAAKPTSSIYKSLLPPTFSASLALVSPLPLELVMHISKAYMLDPLDPMFWDILHNAIDRGQLYNYVEGEPALAITIRKPTGGAKGTTRMIQAVSKNFEPTGMAPMQKLATIVDPSFDLALTDDQKRRRDAVPIPYVHEGEGVDLGLDEEDDEEI